MSISGKHFIFMYVGPGGWNDFDFIMTGGQVYICIYMYIYSIYNYACLFLYYTVLNMIYM